MSVYPVTSNAHFLSRKSMGQQSHTRVKAVSVLPKEPRWRESLRPTEDLISRKVSSPGQEVAPRQ